MGLSRVARGQREFVRLYAARPTREAWRVGYHVLEIGVSVHTVVLRLPDNGRNLVAPGCVECRALPHFAQGCAPEVRDYWRRGLRIPYPHPPPINPFNN